MSGASENVRLDWAAAEVRDGELTVPLSGERPKGFKRGFRHTVRLLGEHADWGAVELHHGTVQVSDVRSGAEDGLRHHLESVVLQAEAAATADQAQPTTPEAAPDGPDGEMTARFRAFADERAGEVQPA